MPSSSLELRRPTPGAAQPERWPVYWLLIANLISNLGNNVTNLAIPWFVYVTTGSASQVGLVAAATIAPLVIATFVGGTLTDRMSHRQLAVMSDILSGLTVATIPLLYLTFGLNIVTLMVLVFLGAIFDGPGMNARQTMIPKLADRAGMSLERVNSGFGIGRSITSLFGAPVAGLLIAWLSAVNALWITAAAFALSATIVRVFLPATSRPESSATTMWADMKEGLVYLFHAPLLRAIALTATVLNMVLSPVFTIGMPVYITNIDLEADALGLLMSSVAAGGLAGSVAYGWIGDRIAPRLVLTISLLLIVLPLFGVAMQPPLFVMWVLLTVFSLGAGVANPMVFTFVQRHTAERMLGRALGTLQSTAMLASPAGLLLGGVLISQAGFGWAVLLGAFAMTAVSLLLISNGTLAQLDQDHA